MNRFSQTSFSISIGASCGNREKTNAILPCIFVAKSNNCSRNQFPRILLENIHPLLCGEQFYTFSSSSSFRFSFIHSCIHFIHSRPFFVLVLFHSVISLLSITPSGASFVGLHRRSAAVCRLTLTVYHILFIRFEPSFSFSRYGSI